MNKIAFSTMAIGFLIFTLSVGERRAVGADPETWRARTDRLVQPYLESNVIVGMTIGVLRDGKREVFGYGRMSRDDRRVPDGDTIYEFGSATKVITGTLLADAVVKGLVKLDQPAVELLPTGVKMPTSGERAITLKDLATHVSGLPRIPDNLKLGNPEDPYADYREEELYAFLNNHTLALAPGKKHEYSNLGQGLLGHLLALQAKSTYEDLVRYRIAVPLKMTSTRITIDKELQSRFAPGHRADGAPAAPWNFPVLAGAGGVRTTVNDLLKFAAANLAPPKNKLGEAIEMAWTIQQPPLNPGEPALGLGWHVNPDGTHWHNGQTGGYHSMMLINRETKSSVILLTNTATTEVDQLAGDILAMICGAEIAPRKFEKPIDVPTEKLQKFVGTYELAPGIDFTVEIVEGKLMIGLTGQPSVPVFARSETVWYSKLTEGTITFEVDKDGDCNTLVLSEGGVEQKAKRKTDSAGPLRKFIGRYEQGPGVVFIVKVKDDKLMIARTGQPAQEFSPSTETVWFCKAIDTTIMFNVDKKGSCDSFVLAQNGAKRKATRKKDLGEALAKFAGKYEFGPGLILTVEAKDGKLMMALTGQPSLPYVARSETVWFCKAVGATITFEVDKNGKCDSLVLLQKGRKQTATRQEEVPDPPKKFDKSIDVPAEKMEKLVGIYELRPGLVFTVEAKDGKLMLALTGQGFNQVYAHSETIWFYKVIEASITFVVDKDGKCDALVLFQNGTRQTFRRKKT